MKNRLVSAFQEPMNLFGLTAAGLVAAAAFHPAPLLLALGAEAVYLVVAPRSKWYESRLAARRDAEVFERRRQLRAQVWPELDKAMRARFERLVEVRSQIGTQAKGQGEWFFEVTRKLDFLLEKWLEFAQKDAQFRAYLNSVGAQMKREGHRVADARMSPERAVRDIKVAYERDLETLRAEANTNLSDSNRAILGKRIEIVERRAEFAGRIGETITNLMHQLELLEDSFALIREELLARSPEQVLGDVEEAVVQTRAMTRVLDEFASMEQMLANL